MIDLSAFRTGYPEFELVSDGLVSDKLAHAANQIDAELFGADTNLAHGLLTAHLLTLSPGGQMARLKKDAEATTYSAQFDKLQAKAACGIRVFG